jgi:hypothetical protein
METPKYHFKQAELYTIARLVIDMVAKSLPRFTAFKGKYTNAWLTAALAQIDIAEDLPNKDQRKAIHQTLHTQLQELNQKALHQFNALERYIAEIFPQDVLQIQIDAAGGAYYTAAHLGDFDATNQLLAKANTFITDNLTQLSYSGNNMPATFQGQFSTLKTNYKNKHIAFLTSESAAQTGRGDKIKANNIIYELITNINADAQAIFINPTDESERNQFTVEHQLQLVRGAGVAGMRFHITNAVTEEDIQDVTVTIKTGVTVTTDKNGRALKLQLAADTYHIKVQKAGFTLQELPIIVQTGTVKRVNIQLQPA